MEALVGFIFLVVIGIVALAKYSHVAEPPQEGAPRTRSQTAFDRNIEAAISIACARGWVSRYSLTQRGLGKFEAVMVLDTARSRGLFDYNPSNRRYYPTNEAYRFRRSTPAKSTPANSTPANSTPAKSTEAKSTKAELMEAELMEAKRWRDRNIRLAMEIANLQGWVSVRLLTNKRNFDRSVRRGENPQPFLTDAEAQELLKDACARGVLRETGPDRYELLEGETYIEADARRQATSTFHSDYGTGPN